MKLPKASPAQLGKTIRHALESNSKTLRLVVISTVLILAVSAGCAIQSGYQTITVTITRHE